MVRRLKDADLSGGGQRSTYVALWETRDRRGEPRKVRVRICRDSYDSQSYAAADLFDGDAWNGIAALPRDRMDVLRLGERGNKLVPVYETPEKSREYFEADEAKLLQEVALILS